MALFTIGYEGRALDDVLGRLHANRIDLVVDVRALPLSRKRGFSKKALAAALTEIGIAYEHRVALGTPRPMRARYKRDKDFPALAAQFKKYLGGQTHSLMELNDLVKGRRACLLCFEADPALCHRSLVAEAARKLGGPKAKHL